MSKQFLCRIFSERTSRYVSENDVKFSTYFPDPMRYTLQNINNDEYIVCPLYEGKLDFQLGITGSHHSHEEFIEITLQREMVEEVGLLPKYTCIDFTKHVINSEIISRKGRQIWNTYSINIKDTYLNTDEYEIKGIDTNYKIGCIIHGPLDIMQIYVNSDIIRYKSSDKIIGVVIVKAIDAKKYYGLI
jgi:hypothetical protein